MMHVVELRTAHVDGSETWQRWRCATLEDATLEAAVVRAAFCDVVDDQWTPEWRPVGTDDDPSWLENDLGERVLVRARSFGDRSQIRFGIFTILAF